MGFVDWLKRGYEDVSIFTTRTSVPSASGVELFNGFRKLRPAGFSSASTCQLIPSDPCKRPRARESIILPYRSRFGTSALAVASNRPECSRLRNLKEAPRHSVSAIVIAGTHQMPLVRVKNGNASKDKKF